MTFKVIYINHVTNKRDTMMIESASRSGAIAELRSANLSVLSVEAVSGMSSIAGRGRSGFHVMSSSSPSSSAGVGLPLTLIALAIVSIVTIAILLFYLPE